MKTLIIAFVLFAADLTLAELLPTQLNIAPDTLVSKRTIRKINYACAKKRRILMFQDLTGDTCVEMTPSELRTFDTELKDDRLSSKFSSDFGCIRKNPSSNPSDINSIVFKLIFGDEDYYGTSDESDAFEVYSDNAFAIKYDFPDVIKLSLPINERYNRSAGVPTLSVPWQTKAQIQYGSLSEIKDEYYTGKDLIITAPSNVTVFWKNEKTGKEIESMPAVRSLEIQCLQDELSKL